MMADFYSGYNDAGARGERTTLAQLQALSGAQNLLGGMADQEAKARGLKRQEEARATLAALGPNATSEQVMAALRPSLNPEQLAPLVQSDITHKATNANTKQIALARIAQQNDKLDNDYNIAVAKITDANERRAADDFYKRAKLALQTEAVNAGGDKLHYETGIRRPAMQMPIAPIGPGTVTSGNAILDPEVLQNPDMAAAVAKINAGGRAPQNIELPSAMTPAHVAAGGKPRIANPYGSFSTERTIGIEADGRFYNIPTIVNGRQVSPDEAIAAWRSGANKAVGEFSSQAEADAAAQGRSNAIGSAATSLPAAPNNLDSRDLRARGQAAFDAAKAATSSPAAPIVPQMPKFSGSPKEIAHQENMWKQAQSKSAGAAQLSPYSLETAGWEKLLFGTDPKGMGNYSAQQRAQVADERDRIGRELKLSPQEMAMMPYDANVKKKAISNMINWGAGVGKAQEQLEKSIDLAMDYVDKLGPGRVQALNKAILAGEKQFNDPDANAYALAVNTVRTEYGRLMTGPTSNAMLPVEAIKKGDQLISNGFDKKSWEEIKSFIRKEAKITKESVDNQVSGLRNSLLPKGAAPETGPAERRAEPRASDKRTIVNF